MKSDAYIAHGEYTTLLCSYGDTPGKAMRKMAKLIDRNFNEDEGHLVLGINSGYDDDGAFCMNVTVSSWR
jgi:hypothetical protein